MPFKLGNLSGSKIYLGNNEVKSVFKGTEQVYSKTTFILATGGTTLTYEDNGKYYKTHTFTSSGNFVVNSLSNKSELNTIDYLIVAGGGGGGGSGAGGGGGAGGYRTTKGTSGRNSVSENKININNQSYTITVGAGGAGGSSQGRGVKGSNTVAFGITSTGGGGGAYFGSRNGENGGSGSGAFTNGSIGLGISGQGFDGGPGGGGRPGGGGGAGQNGQAGTETPPEVAGFGGNGISNDIRIGSFETRAGGGGGGGTILSDGQVIVSPGLGGTGGGGKGGTGFSTRDGSNGIANTGSGGGGGGVQASVADRPGYSGGSGIVIIRYEVGGL